MDPEDDTLDDATDGTDAPSGNLPSALTAAAPAPVSVGVAGKQGAVNAFAAARRALQAARNGDTGTLSNIGGVDYSALQDLGGGPSSDEEKLTLAKALLSPTAYRGISATLGNVSGALLQNAQARRQAQDAQAALLSKYVEAGNVADVNSATKATVAQTAAAASMARAKAAADAKVAAAKSAADAKAAALADAAAVTDTGTNLMAKFPNLKGLDPNTTYTVTGAGKGIAPLKQLDAFHDETRHGMLGKVNERTGEFTPYNPAMQGQLTPAEQKGIDTQKDLLDKADGSIADLKSALEANKLAFAGPASDAAVTAARVTGIAKDRLDATAQLKTLLGMNTVTQLRPLFGARPAAMELKYLQQLQGLDPYASTDERATVIKQVLAAAQKRRDIAARDLESTQTRAYDRVSGKGPMPPTATNGGTPALADLLAEKARRAAQVGAQ